MKFCKKCGSILIKKGEKAICGSCGEESEEEINLQSKEKIEKKDMKEKGIADENSSIHPIVSIECPKCGNNKAFFWTLQTRAGDEAETKFYRCVKCKHTWRDYS